MPARADIDPLCTDAVVYLNDVGICRVSLSEAKLFSVRRFVGREAPLNMIAMLLDLANHKNMNVGSYRVVLTRPIADTCLEV